MSEWPKTRIKAVKNGDFVRMRIRTSIQSDKIGIVSSNVDDDGLVAVYWVVNANVKQGSHTIDLEKVYAVLLEPINESELDSAILDLKVTRLP